MAQLGEVVCRPLASRVVGVLRCAHTHFGGQLKELDADIHIVMGAREGNKSWGSMTGSPAAAEALVVGVLSHGSTLSPQLCTL